MKVRRGFTLIEILVVIGIIMFLSAFVIVAAVRFGNNSREQATKAMIQRIGMGINKYYGTYRVYPAEVGMSAITKPLNIYYYMTPHPDYSKTPVTLTPTMMDFNAGEVRLFAGNYWVVDAWGKQICYYSTLITDANTTDATAVKQAMVGNFKLVSPGPNGIAGDADDITLSKVNY